jgi:hypothetical protein
MRDMGSSGASGEGSEGGFFFFDPIQHSTAGPKLIRGRREEKL